MLSQRRTCRSWNCRVAVALGWTALDSAAQSAPPVATAAADLQLAPAPLFAKDPLRVRRILSNGTRGPWEDYAPVEGGSCPGRGFDGFEPVLPDNNPCGAPIGQPANGFQEGGLDPFCPIGTAAPGCPVNSSRYVFGTFGQYAIGSSSHPLNPPHEAVGQNSCSIDFLFTENQAAGQFDNAGNLIQNTYIEVVWHDSFNVASCPAPFQPLGPIVAGMGFDFGPACPNAPCFFYTNVDVSAQNPPLTVPSQGSAFTIYFWNDANNTVVSGNNQPGGWGFKDEFLQGSSGPLGLMNLDFSPVFDDQGGQYSSSECFDFTSSGCPQPVVITSLRLGVIGTAVGDCNGNGIPDFQEADCNGNGTPDVCDLADIGACQSLGGCAQCPGCGSSSDCNSNGIPDECDGNTLPPAPTGVSASDGASCVSVTISWNVVGGATGYQIWRNTVNNSGTAVQIGTDTASPFSDTTGTPGTTYFYWVKSTNNCGVSGFSLSDSGFRAAVPAAPTGVTATDGTSCSAVTISWNAVGGATGYQIWRNTVNNSGTAVQIGTDTASPFSDSTAIPGTTYFYWLKATNTCGASALSLSDSGFRNSVLAAPSGVSASDAASCSAVTISWTVNGASSYDVWRNSINVSDSAVQIGTDDAPPFSDATAVPGTSYFYWVTAANVCGDSPFGLSDSGSISAGVVITQQPQDQTVWGDVPAQFDVGAEGAAGYQWQRSTDGGNSFSDIAGANSDAYSFFPSAVDNLNQFRCQVGGPGDCPTVPSDPATLTVNVGPTITGQPVSQTAWPGESPTFSVQSTGTPPLTYQWQQQPAGAPAFADIPGANGPMFSFPSVSLPNNGDKLRCNVSNACGVATSDDATVVVAGQFESPPNWTVCEPVASGFVGPKVAPYNNWTVAMDPVNLFSGEFYEEVVDLRIPGRGLDFIWARKYRARYGPDTAIGNGWDFSYNIRIEMFDVHVIVYDGNGRSDIYLKQPNGTYTRRELFNVGVFNGDGTFTLTFPDTGKWNFRALGEHNAPGKIESIVDRNGNTLTFQYGSQDRLTSITDTLDRDIDLFYNGEGLISKIRDFANHEVKYAYYDAGDAGGSSGDLKSMTSPRVDNTPNQNDYIDGKTTVYTYTKDFADPLLNHNLLTITDPKGQTYLQNVYAHTVDPLDPRYTLDPGNVNYDRVVRQIWGDTGDIIDVVYVPLSPSADNCYAVVKATVNDRVGNVKEYLYDACNHLVQQREYTGRADPDSLTNLDTVPPINPPVNPLRPDDPAVFVTCYEYNADSLITRILYPNLNEDIYAYDELNASRRSHGNMLSHCRKAGPLGGDQTPQICESWLHEPNVNFVASHTDYRGNLELHTYDGVGNRVHTQHRIPSIVEDWEYNSFGQVTKHILPDNGSSSRREDVSTYYSAGAQEGYLKTLRTDSAGFNYTWEYFYDDVGNVTRKIDPRGFDTLYDVNELNQVVRKRSPLVNGVRYETLTWYDANDNAVRVDVQNRNEQGALQPNSHFSTLQELDFLNYTTRTCREVGSANLTDTQLDCSNLPAGQFLTTEYEYDGNRNRTLERKGAAVSGAQPPNVLAMQYDERDLAFRRTRGAGGPDASTTQYDYDGNRSRKAERVGLEGTPRVTLWTFDGYDRRVTTVDPMGNVTTCHYDANSNRLSERADGELIDVAGSGGNTLLGETAYQYDAMDRRIRIDVDFFDAQTLTPIGDGLSTTLLVYSDNSQVLQVMDDNDHAATTAYDTANRPSLLTDAEGNTTQYTYDPDSNIVSTIEVEQHDLAGDPDQVFTTTYAYDSLDRRISMTDNVGNVAEYAYDSRNNRVRAVDPLEEEIRYVYDGLDRLLQTVRDMDHDLASATDPDDIVINRAWDDSSRLASQTDGNGHATTYSYDGLDRRIATLFADGTTQTNAFDVHGNIVAVADANGSIVTQTYDLLNRLILRSIAPADGVSNATVSETYQYDGRSRLALGQDEDSSLVREYDSLSHVIRETLNGQTTDFVYDGVGNQTQCVYPGGRVVTQTYDALDRKSVISDQGGMIATYAYVGPDRVARRDYGNGTRTVYQYDGVTGIPNPPDDFGVRQIIGTTHSKTIGGAILDDRTYKWDRMRSKTRRADVRSGGPSLTHAYSYDAADRLVQTTVTKPASGPDLVLRDTTYSLDGVHNRISVAGNPDSGPYVGPYACNATLAEPADCQVNQYTSTPGQARQYDANGNLRRMCGPGDPDAVDLCDLAVLADCLSGPGGGVATGCGAFDYEPDLDIDLADIQDFQNLFTTAAGGSAAIRYDYRNQMVEFHDLATGQRHVYAYDTLGRRIAKVVNSTGIDGLPIDETHFIFDDWREIEEQDAAGATLATYVYGTYVDEVLTMQRGGGDYFVHADDLYNVMAISDAAGGILERYEYDDYGAPAILDPNGNPTGDRQSTIGNPLLFNGRRYDPESRFYAYRTRYLDPTTGRFTAADTIGNWGDPANLGNALSYVANRPWSYVDPFGLTIEFDKGNSKEFNEQVQKDLDALEAQSGEVADVIKTLKDWKYVHKIKESKSVSSKRVGGDQTKTDTGWKVTGGSLVEFCRDVTDADVTGKKICQPRIALAHELWHSYEYDQGLWVFDNESSVHPSERGAVQFENLVRNQLGGPLRKKYKGYELKDYDKKVKEEAAKKAK